MSQLVVFPALLAVACIYTFMVWLAVQLHDSDLVGMHSGKLIAMEVSAADRGADGSQAVNTTQAVDTTQSGSTGNQKDDSQRSLDMINQLNGQIRELEGGSLAAWSMVKELEEQLQDKELTLQKKNQELDAIMETNKALRADNSYESRQRQHLVGLHDGIEFLILLL